MCSGFGAGPPEPQAPDSRPGESSTLTGGLAGRQHVQQAGSDCLHVTLSWGQGRPEGWLPGPAQRPGWTRMPAYCVGGPVPAHTRLQAQPLHVALDKPPQAGVDLNIAASCSHGAGWEQVWPKGSEGKA